MIEALKLTLELDYPNKDNITLRQTLEQGYKSSGGKYRDPRLDQEILVPIEGQYLYELFWKLRSGIGSSGFGPNPISQTELRSWMQNYGVELSPGDVDVIRKLDNIYIEFTSKQIEKK